MMNKKYIKTIIFLLICIVAMESCSEQKKEQKLEKVPTAMSDHWKFQGEAINEPGYDIWGSSPVRDAVGKVHLYVARWKGSIPFYNAWRYNSEIAHYVGETPEGPFKFSDVVASHENMGGNWNDVGFHNPNIRKIDNKYVLVYIANNGSKNHGPSQFIGMLLADKPGGPWKAIPNDVTPILQTPKDSTNWCFNSGCGVTNPSILAHPNGKYYLYFKAMNGPRGKGRVKMGVAVAEKLTGPYEIQKEPITANDRAIEDGYAFVWRNNICLLTTDNHGILEHGGGLLWKSKDGLQFDAEPISGFHHFGKIYLKGQKPDATIHHYGKEVKFERPQILMDEKGEPAYLYCPSGAAIDGSDGTNSYVLKYETR
ncbi:hypothetical protein EYV94_08420 [Puteibacter caeruleilacunae]|nr:hypothetical protein EYV94_08420 [Puteibacter caeruleilacunae]